MTVPFPVGEPHLLVYEPFGPISTCSGTLVPLVGEAKPAHLPARPLMSGDGAAGWAETYVAANTTNITVNAKIGLLVRIAVSGLLSCRHGPLDESAIRSPGPPGPVPRVAW